MSPLISLCTLFQHLYRASQTCPLPKIPPFTFLPTRRRRYGEAQTSVASQQSDSVIWVDPYGTPGYTLEFKYRSRALLELEDIVKRAQGPPAYIPFC